MTNVITNLNRGGGDSVTVFRVTATHGNGVSMTYSVAAFLVRS